MNPLAQTEEKLCALMVRTQCGDSAACEQLLTQVSRLARSYVNGSLRRVGIAPDGRAEDIVQEILLAVYSKCATYDSKHCFLPWMYAIAKYKLIDNLRTTKGHRSPVALESVPEISVNPDFSDALDVEQLLQALPAKQRLLLGLVKLEGFTTAEAAKKTGTTQSSVKVSVHRALKRLKDKFN